MALALFQRVLRLFLRAIGTLETVGIRPVVAISSRLRVVLSQPYGLQWEGFMIVNERVARSRQKSLAKLFFVVGLLLLLAPVIFQDVAWVHDSIYALLISGAVLPQ